MRREKKKKKKEKEVKKNRRKGKRRHLTQDDRISLAGTDLVVANITEEVRGVCRGRGVFLVQGVKLWDCFLSIIL